MGEVFAHLCCPGNSCDACVAIDSWIEEHGYCFSGAAAREVYLPLEEKGNFFSLADMQIPVERKNYDKQYSMHHTNCG
jgi:hypothetical protein